MEGRSDDCFNDDGRLILRLDCCIIGCSRDDTAVMGAIVVIVDAVFCFCLTYALGKKRDRGQHFAQRP